MQYADDYAGADAGGNSSKRAHRTSTGQLSPPGKVTLCVSLRFCLDALPKKCYAAAFPKTTSACMLFGSSAVFALHVPVADIQACRLVAFTRQG